MAGWPVILTDVLAGWPVTVGVVEVGVSANQQQTLSGTYARVYTAQCTQGLAGRGDGYQCDLELERSAHNGQQKLNLRRNKEGDKQIGRPAGNSES